MKIRSLALCLMLITVISTLSAADNDNTLVEDAWKALRENRQQDAIQSFESAIKANPDNRRAYLGLMYIHNMQDNYSGAGNALENVLLI